MNINEVNRVGLTNPYRKHMQTGNASSVDRKGRKDEVQISEEAKRLLESQETTAIDPAKAKKLEELKESVATGTYKVESGLVAEKLLPFLGSE
jgi:negative regulator of flagellin synthesis FlgM